MIPLVLSDIRTPLIPAHLYFSSLPGKYTERAVCAILSIVFAGLDPAIHEAVCRRQTIGKVFIR
jgi:hypothetical protein